MTVIYALVDPKSGDVRYIGKTKNIRHRLQQHVSKARHHLDHHCARWIRTLLDQGMTPQIVVVSEVPPHVKWQHAEAAAIAFYRMAGHDLTNLTAGGDGFHDMHPECIRRAVETRKRTMSDPVKRAEVSKTSKAAHSRPEVKAKHSAAASAMWADPETRARLMDAARKPETRALRSEKSRLRMADRGVRDRHTALMKELSKDPQRREQIRQAGKERWLKPDAKAKHLAKQSLFYSDPAKRDVIGASSKERWADPKHKASIVAAMKQHHKDDPTHHEKILDGLRKHWHDPVSRAEHTAKIKAASNQPEERERRRQRVLARFDDPEYCAANRERLRLGREKRWADYRARKGARL